MPRDYDALSYVWGDTTERTPIQVNNRTLMITTNLRTALLNIRQLDQPCILWVDAVCIDQDSVMERNHQVSLMDKIYRNAARTIVWLRDSHPQYTGKAYAMVDELAAEAISRQQPYTGIDDYSLPLSLLDLKRVESPLFDRFKDDFSVLHLACASWWFRTWTVQEILLASQAVVMAGTYTMDWDRFSAGVNHGLAIGIWNPVMLGIMVDPIVVPYLSIHAIRRERRRPPRPHLPSPRLPAVTPAQTLLELLIKCRFRQASDPRDKVYALLGLIDVEVLGIEPNYWLSASEVYCHAARQLLVQSGDLNVLGACTPTESPELPSWVPTWSTTASERHPLMHDALGRPRQTHASGGTTAAPRFFYDGSVLALSGHEVITITHLSPALHRLHRDTSDFKPMKRGDTLLERLATLGQLFTQLVGLYWELSSIVPHLATFWEWEAFARESPALRSQDTLSPPIGSDPPVGEGEGGYDPLATYWQTLCVGTLAAGGRHATARLFYLWRASLQPIFHLHRWRMDSLFRPLAFVGYLKRTWRNYSEFARLLEPVYERRLGRGENGFLVLLPEEAEVGDRIALVKGGRVPLVLRRDEGVGEGGYRLVGEAYVHGVMDGERFEEGKCVEMKIQ